MIRAVETADLQSKIFDKDRLLGVGQSEADSPDIFEAGEIDRFPDVLKVFKDSAGVFHPKQFTRLRLMGKSEGVVAHHTNGGKTYAHCEASVM